MVLTNSPSFKHLKTLAAEQAIEAITSARKRFMT